MASVYVLLNFRKHLRAPPVIDPCSSGPWFDGWTDTHERRTATLPDRARTSWFGSVGWRRAGGPISVHESATRCK